MKMYINALNDFKKIGKTNYYTSFQRFYLAIEVRFNVNIYIYFNLSIRLVYSNHQYAK